MMEQAGQVLTLSLARMSALDFGKVEIELCSIRDDQGLYMVIWRCRCRAARLGLVQGCVGVLVERMKLPGKMMR